MRGLSPLTICSEYDVVSGAGREPPPDKSFSELVGKVRRLTHDTVQPQRARSPLRPRPVPVATSASPALIPQAPSDFVATDSTLSAGHEFHRPGLQHSVLRKLRRGHYPVQDELDLHGLTLREAGARLGEFLLTARGRRLSCVRIIHGKGLSSPGRVPVLKPQVARWLREHTAVLAFTAARRADGGDGAMYVLLRSQRE